MDSVKSFLSVVVWLVFATGILMIVDSSSHWMKKTDDWLIELVVGIVLVLVGVCYHRNSWLFSLKKRETVLYVGEEKEKKGR